MALIDISHVTNSIINLIKWNVNRLHDGDDVEVIANPPNAIGTMELGLTMYMYHVSEDPFYKNQTIPGNSAPHVAATPMALSLYYVLTAHDVLIDSDNFHETRNEQALLGYAMKTLHDYPVITDELEGDKGDMMDPIRIMDENIHGLGNQIQIILRPMAPEDAVSFWSSEDSGLPKPSAFYEVRVIMLRPEKPERMPGTVLEVGNFLYQLGSASLTDTVSHAQFPVPAQYGGFVQDIETVPAKPVQSDTTHTQPFVPGVDEVDDRDFQIRGVNLTRGLSRRLSISGPAMYDDGGSPAPLDRAFIGDGLSGSTWLLDYTTDQINVRVAPEFAVQDFDGVERTALLVPGAYSLALEVVTDEQFLGGELKQIKNTSNEVTLLVAPNVSFDPMTVTAPPVNTVSFEFSLPNGISVEDKDTVPLEDVFWLDLQLVVAGVTFTRVESGFSSDRRNEFMATNIGGGVQRVEFRPVFDVAGSSNIYPVQLLVNGAASHPLWLVTT